jgi:multiple sugar transport system substrate-binding protein
MGLFFHVLLWLQLMGCTGPQDGITLSVGGAPAELDFWQSLVGQFEQEKGIRVDVLRQPTDTDQRRQSLVVALEAKKEDPDVFLMDVVWIAQFAASNWLQSIEHYVETGAIDLDVFFQNVVNFVDRYRGDLIALPIYVDGGLLYYRKDLLEQFGIEAAPETWEQLVESAEKVQRHVRKRLPNFHGFVWQGAQYEGLICNFMEFVGANGGGISIMDGKIALNTQENVKAIQFMHDLIHKYKISPLSTSTEMREEQARETFQRGNALFERNWPYAWSLHQAPGSIVKGKTAIASLPRFSSGKNVSALGGWHIGISRFSDQKESGWELVKFLASYETQKKLALNLGWNPGRKDLYSDPEVLRDMPHLTRLQEVFTNARPRPTLPYYTQLSEVIQRYLNSALTGMVTPQNALASAEREAQAVVDRYQAR